MPRLLWTSDGKEYAELEVNQRAEVEVVERSYVLAVVQPHWT